MNDAPHGTTRMTRRERWLAAAAFLLVALAFLAKGLPPGTAPVCVDPLYSDPLAVPFAEKRPADFEPHNPFLSDHTLVFDPWLRFMRAAVLRGELPLWSPESGGGVPFIGNLSSAFFFPTTWLCFVPLWSVERGMWLGAVVKLWLAGFFGYLFLRRLRLSRVASASGAAAMMLAGYNVVWLFYSLSNVSCCLPLCMYLAQCFVERPGVRQSTLLAAAMALQFYGGHAETSLAVGIAVTAWVLGGFRLSALGFRQLMWRYAGVGALALALAAPQLLPFVEYLRLSHGRVERLATAPIEPMSKPWLLGVIAIPLVAAAWWLLARPRHGWPATFGALGAGALLTGAIELTGTSLSRLLLAVEPDIYGNPLHDPGYRGPESFTDVNGGYVGALVLCLALLYLIGGTNRRIRWTCGTLMFLGWVLAARIGPFATLLRHVPPFDLAAGTRMLPLYSLGASILAAFALVERRSLGSTLQRLFVCAVVIVLSPNVLFMLQLASHESHEVRPRANGLALEASMDVVRDGREGRDGRVEFEVRAEVPVDVESASIRIGSREVARFTPTQIRAANGVLTASVNLSRADEGDYVLAVDARTNGVTIEGPRETFTLSHSPGPTVHGEWRILGCLFLLLWFCRGGPGILLAPLVVLAELFLFGFDYNAYVPEAWVYPPTRVTDVLRAESDRALAEGRGPLRFVGEDVILQPNSHYAYGLQTPQCYDQLDVARFDVLQRQAGVMHYAGYSRREIDFASPLLRVMNLGLVVTGSPLDASGYEKIFGGAPGDVGFVYRNTKVLPRAFVVNRALDVNVAPPAEALASIADAALLEETPPAGLTGNGTARITAYRLNSVDVEVDSDGPALLVLTDNAFPGWTAAVNGDAARILRTHWTFRAVPIPAGHSTVRFRYRPLSFLFGLALAGLGALVAVGLSVRARRENLKNP